jgi:hypothetical protein
MIYCGSGSDFGKVSVPVPFTDNIKYTFSTTKNVQILHSCLFDTRSSIISRKIGLLFLIFLLLDPVPILFRNRIWNRFR